MHLGQDLFHRLPRPLIVAIKQRATDLGLTLFIELHSCLVQISGHMLGVGHQNRLNQAIQDGRWKPV
jgi:hypothetical protein